MQWASQNQTPDQNWDGAASDFEMAASRTTHTKSTKNYSQKPRSESTCQQYNFPSCHRLGVTGSCEAQIPEVAGISEYTINRT
jgi:hypothetical protein